MRDATCRWLTRRLDREQGCPDLYARPARAL